MSKYLFSYGVLALALLILAPHTARATMFSGNPTTDGWTVGGYSNNIGLTNLPAGFTNPPGPFVQGTYVSGAGKALYVLYFNQTTATAEFLTECGMALCGAWQVGDKIVGMGAVFPAVPGGGTQNNTASVFLKWGVSSSAYSVSSLLPTIGNGNSNYDVGEGGLGSVFASLNLSAGGVVTAPSTAFQWTGITSQSIGPLNSIVFNSLISGGVFTSFQGYLNVTLINSINPYLLPALTFNGSSIVGVRFGSGLDTNALIGGVPEPATGLLSAGAFLAIWMIRRRQRTLAS